MQRIAMDGNDFTDHLMEGDRIYGRRGSALQTPPAQKKLKASG